MKELMNVDVLEGLVTQPVKTIGIEDDEEEE